MSETKHTPLPLPREVGGHVWLIELPAFDRSVHGQPITIADRQMAFDLVNRYNAGSKVEELVEAVNKLKGHLEETGEYRICRADKEQMGLPDQMTIGQVLCDIEDKAREVEAALGGKAE